MLDRITSPQIMCNRIIIVFLFFCSLTYAQLSVKNNAYVFISNEIVFVNNDINLNDSASTIYLRDEAQIIQGSGTTGNSGVGELSVYQEGNVDEFEYNYWCSPIGSKMSSSVNNPFGISLLNDVTGLISSAPASYIHKSNYNGTSIPLNIEPYWIYKYIAGSNYSDWIHVQATTTINPGEGFTMKGTNGSSSAQRYDFRGKPNTGTIGVAVLANKFTLVGNPYPSAIDALKYIHDTENASVITGVLYYWEQNPSVNSHYLKDYDGGYATYTITSGGTETYIPATFNTYNGDGSINITNTGTGVKTAKRYIPIGQGFMVEGKAIGTVKAKNSHRVFVKESSLTSTFFKTDNNKEMTQKGYSTEGFSILTSDYKRFRLNIDFNNTYTRQIAETFHDNATKGFDYGLEIKTSPDNVLKSDAYWSNDDDSYFAEALPFNQDLKIALNITVAQKMPVKIRIADIQNFENSQPIYLHDIERDTYVDLRIQDFNINLETGHYPNRFEISFVKSNALNVKDNVIEDIKILQNNTLSELIINNPNSLEVKSFRLFDISGKRVFTDDINSTKREFIYSTKLFSDGVYFVEIESSNNKILNKKIIIANKK